MLNNLPVNITSLVILSSICFIYILIQYIKRVMIRELDSIIYNAIIEWLLLGEYCFIGISLMKIARFNALEMAFGFSIILILRFITNKFLYNWLYRKIASAVKSHNTFNK